MDWKKLSTNKISKVYYRLFLNRCYLCDTVSHHSFCYSCQTGLLLNDSHCLQCKRPIHDINQVCGHCQIQAPTYQRCVAPYRFEGIIKTLIHSVKFHQNNHYIRPLMSLLSEHLRQEYDQQAWPEQLIYVPSHPHRIKERGFCQTRAMSTQLIKQLRHHDPNLAMIFTPQNPLIKAFHTQAQHSLSRKARLNTPRNLYQVTGQIARHVALFDDVMTTGSTVEHCCQQLIQAGAERVDVWVLARTADKAF